VAFVLAAPPLITIEPVGAVPSSVIVSVAAVLTLPAASRNSAKTVLEPSPATSVQAAVELYDTHPPHAVPLLLNRICASPEPPVSLADRTRLTAVVFVYAATPLIDTAPVGSVVSSPIVSVIDALGLPATSRNWTYTVLDPVTPSSVQLLEVA